MVSNIVSYSILLLYLLPCASWSQGNDVDLSLEQSLDLLHKEKLENSRERSGMGSE